MPGPAMAGHCHSVGHCARGAAGCRGRGSGGAPHGVRPTRARAALLCRLRPLRALDRERTSASINANPLPVPRFDRLRGPIDARCSLNPDNSTQPSTAVRLLKIKNFKNVYRRLDEVFICLLSWSPHTCCMAAPQSRRTIATARCQPACLPFNSAFGVGVHWPRDFDECPRARPTLC